MRESSGITGFLEIFEGRLNKNEATSYETLSSLWRETVNIEINDEIADEIVKIELKSSIDGIKRDIKILRNNPFREKYQNEDLDYNLDLLPHLEAVYEYFGRTSPRQRGV